MNTVAIYGASGYTGLELIRLLEAHPQFEVGYAASDSYAGQRYRGVRFEKTVPLDSRRFDLVFLCTPHGASAPLARQALEMGAKVVDLSADLRLRSPESYQRWYDHPHPEPQLLPVPYGLPEFWRAELAGASLIANPGCYPTTSLLALFPLARAGGIRPHTPLIVDAKSGVSGAGRKASLETHFVEVYGDFKPYNIGRKHRHVGEIEQELGRAGTMLGPLVFSPHLLPVDRGLLATCYVTLAEGWTLERVRELYAQTYAQEALVTLLDAGETARLREVVRTNGAQISIHPATDEALIIVSALDNLLKGASSQALQNANLMFGYPETLGLV